MGLSATGRPANLKRSFGADLRGVLANLVVLSDNRGDLSLMGRELIASEIALLADIPNDPHEDPNCENYCNERPKATHKLTTFQDFRGFRRPCLLYTSDAADDLL